MDNLILGLTLLGIIILTVVNTHQINKLEKQIKEVKQNANIC